MPSRDVLPTADDKNWVTSRPRPSTKDKVEALTRFSKHHITLWAYLQYLSDELVLDVTSMRQGTHVLPVLTSVGRTV